MLASGCLADALALAACGAGSPASTIRPESTSAVAPSTSQADPSTDASKRPASKKPASSEQPAADEAPDRGPDLTVSQQNAVESAESYLSFIAFSRSGLIDQLEFEGFTRSQAEYGVSAVGL